MRIYWIKDSKTNWRQRMVCWLEINCSSSGPRCFIAWHLNVPIIFPIRSLRDGFSPSSGHSAAYAKSIYSSWRSVGANVWKMLPPPPRTTERLNRKIFKFGAKWKAARPLADGRQWRHAPYLHTSTRNEYGPLASPHYQSGNSISPPPPQKSRDRPLTNDPRSRDFRPITHRTKITKMAKRPTTLL